MTALLTQRPIRPLIEEVTKPDGRRGLRYNLHAGQRRSWESFKRFILILAGLQSGKTSFGPLWLHREICRRGPGDYLVATPTYRLLELKALPEFLSLFKRRLNLGDYSGQTHTFTYHDGSVRVLFGHATKPDSLESATIKAAWLDECGQLDFRLGSWEAIQGRLSIHQGRALLTTTPYILGWLKQRLFDPWVKSARNHPEIDVVNFSSLSNPLFPREEYERMRRELPGWRFRMRYLGIFEKPAGAIYDCFSTEANTCPRFAIPDDWPRYVGLDFGGINTAAVYFAEEVVARHGPPRPNRSPLGAVPLGKLYAYRTYWPRQARTAKEHVAALLKDEPRRPTAIGGSASEDQWRAEFAAAGLAVREPPIKEVEVGINRVYGALQRGELVVFDDLHDLLDDFGSYSREVDEMGEPTEKIADKESWHRLDAVRYALSYLRGGKLPAGSWGMERI